MDAWLWLPIGYGLAMLALVAWCVWRDHRHRSPDAAFIHEAPPSGVARIAERQGPIDRDRHRRLDPAP